MPDLGWSNFVRGVEDSAWVDAVFECQWFEDDGGSLLIPDPWGDDWAVDTGISPEVTSALNLWYQEHFKPEQDRLPEISADTVSQLGLRIVEQPLKRWNETDGFYHA